MSRLSDYFSCWKLHMLLQRFQNLGNISQSQILDPSECSLDYSVWRNYLEKETSKRNGEKDLLANTVKITKIGDGHSGNKNEESKLDQGNTDYLLNYTFDLSLDEHM